jgi:hypothetical protein
MASTQRTVRILLMAVGAIALVFRPTAAVAQDRPKITVTVYNRSKMRTPTLTAGHSVAQEVLRRAGVESIWVDCPVPSTPEANPACQQPLSPNRLILTIVPHWGNRRLDSNALGVALQVEHGFGSYCYVFQERLDELAAATHISPARLLGHAMAHEIGHLLKGSDSHSPQGLMSEHWHANELQAAAMESLNFTAEDASLMRPRLAQAEGRK